MNVINLKELIKPNSDIDTNSISLIIKIKIITSQKIATQSERLSSTHESSQCSCTGIYQAQNFLNLHHKLISEYVHNSNKAIKVFIQVKSKHIDELKAFIVEENNSNKKLLEEHDKNKTIKTSNNHSKTKPIQEMPDYFDSDGTPKHIDYGIDDMYKYLGND